MAKMTPRTIPAMAPPPKPLEGFAVFVAEAVGVFSAAAPAPAVLLGDALLFEELPALWDRDGVAFASFVDMID